jgi:hypothetical protein
LKLTYKTIARGLAVTASALNVLTALSGAAQACDTCESKYKPGTYTGDMQRIGNGVAYSWVTLNEKGKPSSIGMTLTESALEGLPEKGLNGMPSHGFDLMLPKQAEKTAFNHILFEWNPQGHVPRGVYDKPHFDIHFYTIPVEARMKITAQGADIAKTAKTVPAAYAPKGYIYAKGTEVPMMGGHWVDPTAPELNGQPFTNTFLYGSYDGKMIFFEPMLTKAWMETKPDYALDIKVPASYLKSGFYPTKYTVRYDATRHEYTVALEGLVWREGTEKAKAAPSVAAKTVKPAAQPASKTAKK